MPAADIGLPYQIGLVSRSPAVSLTDLVKVSAALNLQITRDFAPIWGISASVGAVPNPDSIEPGIWPIFVEDDIGADAAGFHQTQHNQPFARVCSGATWSLTASHECLEMLADPTGNRLYPSIGIGLVNGQFQDAPETKFEYLMELCDPCQSETAAYMINDVMVSDFYTPRFFDPVAVGSVRYSFSGRIKRPREILGGGYLSWRDPTGSGFRQARFFDRPVIVSIPLPKDAMPSRATLRGLLDRLTPSKPRSNLPPDAPISMAQSARRNWLGAANATRAALYGAVPRRNGTMDMPSEQAIAVIIAANRSLLAKPGVMLVRPGWRLMNGWLQSQRAIVVVAAADRAEATRAALPADVEGVPVDVRPANALQTLRHTTPHQYAALASGPRQEYEVPVFPGEIHFGETAIADTEGLLAAARARKPQIEYTRPPGVTLDEITEQMTLTLNASPDAGWQVLKDFLTTTPGDLVVGMYDFTSPHIEQALLGGIGTDKNLTLTLDHPPGKATREQTIDTTASDLDRLGRRLNFAWALEREDHKAAAWIYPSAYHIKVAVRLDDTLWLSSGNWNTSNQPEIDLADRAAAIEVAKKSDRDWHVVAQSPGLAAVFRAVLQFDNTEALAHQAADGTALAATPDVPPELLTLEAVQPRQTVTFFLPHRITGRLRVRPLLTPLDYHKPVLDLINGARERFWMQTQYIKVSGRPGDEDHDALITAVAGRVSAGVDVRLITSEFQTADLIEKLMNAGLDQSVLRIQPHVHNKGMIVDSRTVVISSQNWSADGTLRNRDAGIILYDNPESAQYFEQIFLHDWANLASQHVVG